MRALKSVLILIYLLYLLVACKETSSQVKVKAFPPVNIKTSPIDGAWELVWEQVDGKTKKMEKPSQIKLFVDGHFSYIMQDSTGRWSNAGAGTFELSDDNKTYKEKHLYNSTPAYVGAIDWQEYKVKGDTLVFTLFTKVTMADGKDVTANFPKSIEKRVRAKI